MTSAQITAAAAGTWTLRGGAGTTGPEPGEVLAVARARGVTAAQVRLAWTLQRGPHVLAIPGTADPGHLAENVAAGALRLSPDELARLGSPGGITWPGTPVHRPAGP
jgi:aryl-alcohol dehydrogenase-like predicted oxidoreductase